MVQLKKGWTAAQIQIETLYMGMTKMAEDRFCQARRTLDRRSLEGDFERVACDLAIAGGWKVLPPIPSSSILQPC